MVPRVGQKVGPYEILGRLGSGGMGLVFSAWDARLQRDVAIKLLREEFATPGMRSRFLLEARAASRLNHPNICTIFDIGEQEGDPYLVMELLKGETARARIARGAISTEDILRVATEVADALTVAHAGGIIHRDIKPANIILVDKHGGRFQTKVLDFGLAKIDVNNSVETRFDLTTVGTTVGTVSYMSPEQAKGEPLDARSDLFSLGVVLYEMATGELPFQGATSALVFVQLLGQRPELIRDFSPDFPKDFDRLILKLLEKKRSDRFQSAGELVEALHKIVLKRSGSGKSIWGSKSSRASGRSEFLPQATVKPESSGFTASPPKSRLPGSDAVRPSSSSESFIRPVKRIITGETPRAVVRPDSHPSAPLPLAGTTPSPVPGTQRAGTQQKGTPLSSGTYRPAAPSEPQPAATPINSPKPEAPPSRIPESAGAPHVAASSPSKLVSRRPVRSFVKVDLDEEEPARGIWESNETETYPANTSRKGRWIALVVLLAAAGGFFAWHEVTHRPAAAANVPTSLLLASLSNRTGDSTLGGVLVAGLFFDLQESPHLSVRAGGDLAAGLALTGVAATTEPSMEDARRAAKAVGASNIVVGDIHTEGSSYAVALRVYDTTSGTLVTEANEVASSREQVADAIDRASSDLRSGLGETGDSIAQNSVPLNREATANFDALQAYVTGDTLLSSGRIGDAMFAFERAIGMEPHFTQANLRLAEIYRRDHAEVAAAKAATEAQSSSTAAGNRTQLLAQASYALNALGDYEQAIHLLQQVVADYPADIEAQSQIALAQRLEGKYAESLQTAQGILKLSPYDSNASGDAELALIGLDQTDAAAQIEAQSQKAGRSHPGIEVLLTLLGSSPDSPAIPDFTATPEDQLAPEGYVASALDAEGQFTAGLSKWMDIANRTRSLPELASTASYALSEAALDRALASDCLPATALVRQAAELPAGPDATYAAGMAAALCGSLDDARRNLSTLTSGWPQSFAARGFYIPSLTGVIQWKSGDAPEALTMLQSAKPYDRMSLTPYLRGMVHFSADQPQLAVEDIQPMLAHRGAAMLTNAMVYPMAQLELARAYTANGDLPSSKSSYGRFLNLWAKADPSVARLNDRTGH